MAEESEDGQEKSEEPTARKLEKAREDGQLPRSKELSTSVVLIVGALTLVAMGPYAITRLSIMTKYNLAFDRQAATDPALMFAHLSESFLDALLSVTPMLIALLIASIAGPISLSGWNFSTKAISPNLGKLNPLKGIKRMFSMNALMELLKGWAKVIVVSVMAGLVFWFQFDAIRGLLREPHLLGMKHLMETLAWAFLLICASTLIIAAIDIPFQIQSHIKKMRMTLQEVKDEYKNTEGKPEVKSKIRQLQREISQRQMMTNVPDADVVITNPDHFAVALKYKPNEMPAPILVAKGADLMAEKIKEVAREYKIPILQIPPLARSIYHFTEIDDEIPEGLYLAVAQVLAYIYQMEQWAKGRAPKPEDKPEYPVPDDLRWDG